MGTIKKRPHLRDLMTIEDIKDIYDICSVHKDKKYICSFDNSQPSSQNTDSRICQINNMNANFKYIYDYLGKNFKLDLLCNFIIVLFFDDYIHCIVTTKDGMYAEADFNN
jgi:hypothetical protein